LVKRQMEVHSRIRVYVYVGVFQTKLIFACVV